MSMITTNTDTTEKTPKQQAAADLIRQEGDAYGWAEPVKSAIYRELTTAAAAAGIDPNQANTMFSSMIGTLLIDANSELLMGKPHSALGRAAGGGKRPPNYWTGTQEGYEGLLDYSRSWAQRYYKNLAPYWQAGIGDSSASSGSGSGLPTDAEVRQAFDLNKLASDAQNIYRGLVLDELKDPMAWARQYVDTVVASHGQQKLDFQTFIEGKTKQTGRYASIYKNKPDSMTPQQFLQPYMQSAQQVLGGSKEAAPIAIAGAQFGASQPAFQARLNRTDAVTGSAPFINSLESRMREVSKVFRT